MPGLVPGIHVFDGSTKKDMDGRDKPGHDGIAGSIIDMIGAFTGGTECFFASSTGLRRY
jgi:hypothetical protein